MEGAVLSRRSVLSGVVTAPAMVVVSHAAPPGSTPVGPPGAWERALQSYLAARKAHVDFLAQVLDPAVRSARAHGEGLTPAIIRLEQRGDALCGERHDALSQLAVVRVSTIDQLRLKFRLVWEEALRTDDHTGFLHMLLADLESLPGP